MYKQLVGICLTYYLNLIMVYYIFNVAILNKFYIDVLTPLTKAIRSWILYTNMDNMRNNKAEQQSWLLILKYGLLAFFPKRLTCETFTIVSF